MSGISGAEVRYYTRFTPAQRLLHGVLMVTFLGLAATGLVLRFSSAPWSIGLARVIGGFPAILFFHKLCAVLLWCGGRIRWFRISRTSGIS
jgi:hypothetical protein